MFFFQLKIISNFITSMLSKMANTFLSCSLIILDKQEKTPSVSLFITWGVEDLFRLKMNKNY